MADGDGLGSIGESPGELSYERLHEMGLIGSELHHDREPQGQAGEEGLEADAGHRGGRMASAARGRSAGARSSLPRATTLFTESES
jgi:hypothetical protein